MLVHIIFCFQEFEDNELKNTGMVDIRTISNLLKLGQEQRFFETHQLSVPANGLGSKEQTFKVVCRYGTKLTEDFKRQVGRFTSLQAHLREN